MKTLRIDTFGKEVAYSKAHTPEQKMADARRENSRSEIPLQKLASQLSKPEDIFAANFLNFLAQLAFCAVLSSLNETLDSRLFLTVKSVQSRILELRDFGRHDEASHLEHILDQACLVKKFRHTSKGITSTSNDGSSEITRETIDTESAKDSSSFFSSKLPHVDRSDRLDLSWLRQFFDESEIPDDLQLTMEKCSSTSSSSICGSKIQFLSQESKNSSALNLTKQLKGKRRQIKEVARKCGWTQYDIYNAHLLIEFLENRLPDRPRQNILARLFKRKRFNVLYSSDYGERPFLAHSTTEV